MNSPGNAQETSEDPDSTETFLCTVHIDEAIVQEIQRQNGLYSIHAFADRPQTFYDLFHRNDLIILICSQVEIIESSIKNLKLRFSILFCFFHRNNWSFGMLFLEKNHFEFMFLLQQIKKGVIGVFHQYTNQQRVFLVLLP